VFYLGGNAKALQKVDRYSKMWSMEKEIKCPKCG